MLRSDAQGSRWNMTIFLLSRTLDLLLHRARGGNRGGTEALFGVLHFAGEVIYDATEFVEKNRDEVPPALHDLVLSSNDRCVVYAYTLLLRFAFSSKEGTKW